MLSVIFLLNFVNLLAADAKKISFLEKIHSYNNMHDSDEFKAAREPLLNVDHYNQFFEEITSDRKIRYKEQLVHNKRFIKAFFENEFFKIIPGEKTKLFSIKEEFVINKEILKTSEFYDIFYSKIIDQSKKYF
jgi:hypothetical protein